MVSALNISDSKLIKYAQRLLSGEGLFQSVAAVALRWKKIPLPVETLMAASEGEPVALATWRSALFPLLFRRRRVDPGIPNCGTVSHDGRHLVVEEPWIRNAGRQSFPEGLRELTAAARIVHAAHSGGALHLDIKPCHLCTSSARQVFVLDWEAAMPIRVGQRSSAVGFVGTPRYMAPEQAAGCIDQLTPRTDVFGLGLVLYELLHGRPARLPQASFVEALRAAACEEVRCSRAVAVVERSLTELCESSTSFAPESRPHSAMEFANRLTHCFRQAGGASDA
tara:strand:+ start:1019 stop:1861 length:843 start_codon:yes stop_codon:yes gene_type:complete